MIMAVSPSSVLRVADTTPHQFGVRAVLPAKPNTVWRIDAGVVRSLTWLDDGTFVVLGVWGSGDVIGQPISKLDPYQIECLTKVTATPLPFETLENLTAITLSHLQQAEELMLIRSYKRVEVMLVRLLSSLAKRFGQQTDDGHLIDLRLTHQDLADLLGATRVTVTRILSQLEQQGTIQRRSLQRIVLREEEMWHYEI